MPNSIDFSGRPFHFIGIGGIGMSAIAHILTRRKLPVSGSDLRLTHITQRLQDQGVHIFLSQKAENLGFFRTRSDFSSDFAEQVFQIKPEPYSSNSSEPPTNAMGSLPQVICSTAIHLDNPEYREAVEIGCPIYHRSDVLSALVQHSHGIAVAGTHGKTTTSSMIGYLLLEAGLDPTIVVGGEVEAWQGNARLGDSDYLVAEADESDGSLVKFAPKVGVITNIELDHPDHYQSLDEVVQTFKAFAQNCDTLVGCADCQVVSTRIQPDITYSVHSNIDATYRADQIEYQADGTKARIWEGQTLLGNLWIPVLGEHNLSNALAAIVVGRLAGVEFNVMVEAFQQFRGARRRFEHRGEHHNIQFIDDYAHHPSEIQATLSSAHLQVKNGGNNGLKRVVAVFQPHRYSRAAMFMNEFGQSFSDADLVIATEVYSAGESPTGHVDGHCLAESISAHHPNVFYRSTLADVSELLKQTLAPGDLVVFLGAGNLNRIIPDLLDFYQRIQCSDLPTVCSTLV
ncbi:MAG: UDP-N-acetylmuramate--L-alanine ligase [Cyanobacteria bacterium P01_F01_bin.150]